MKIVTGYAGEKHITSNDDQGLNQGLLGVGNYILSVGNQFAANMVSANELQIEDGEGVIQGVHFRVEPETTDSVTIENGSQGMQRIDLVCAQYSKDALTGVESMEWVVIKGEEAASDPAEPSYTAGDILAGDTLAQFPVYSVTLDGITVDSVTLLAQMLSTQAETDAAISALNSSINNITYFNCTDAGSYYDIVRQNCYAIGKRVFISVELVVTSANPPTNADVCVIPAGYRPASALNNKGFVYHLRSSGGDVWSDLRPALISISTSGAVRQGLSSAFPLNEVVVVWAEYMCA